MKYYTDKREFFNSYLQPKAGNEFAERLGWLVKYSQIEFNKKIRDLGFHETGELPDDFLDSIEKAKKEMKDAIAKFSGSDQSRIDFEFAYILHKNLKIDRAYLSNWGFWRWLNMNFFLEETRWRYNFKNSSADYFKFAKIIFDHLVDGTGIMVYRCWFLGERLTENDANYDLLKQLDQKAKMSRPGGFGNYILNLVDTRLISPRDNVSKIMGKLMFIDNRPFDDKEVVNSFKKYNCYKNRSLVNAGEHIFKNEICLVDEKLEALT